MGQPLKQPHEYVREGTAKLMTLFRPATGELRVKGVLGTPNKVLHVWLQQEIEDVLNELPADMDLLPTESGKWLHWQQNLSVHITSAENISRLRMLLIMDLPVRSSHTVVRVVAACARRPAAVHAHRRIMAQPCRIHAAHPGATGIGGPAFTNARSHH